MMSEAVIRSDPRQPACELQMFCVYDWLKDAWTLKVASIGTAFLTTMYSRCARKE